MNYNSDIFQNQFPLAKRFVYHITYFRQLRRLYDRMNLQSEFWTHTIDAHLLQASSLWCMVFGSHGCNPTHWKKLTASDSEELQRSFREGLFSETYLDETQWNHYWNEMVRFRNEFVAHREILFRGVVPKFDIALEVVFYYDRWIRDVISPDILDESSLDTTAMHLEGIIQPLLKKLLQNTQQYNQDNKPPT